MFLQETFLAGTFATSFVPSAGKIVRSRHEADVTPQHVEMSLPTGVQAVGVKPVSVTYRNRWYEVGGASDNILVDEHFRVLRQGILPPAKVPTLAAGAGTGITGSCRVALRFYDEDTDEWSPRSGWSNTVSLSNQNRVTSNIPTTAQDSRVTHVAVEVEIDGGTPRIATMRQLGVSSITENVATLALGEAVDDFQRMPRGTTCEVYHDRLCVSGDAHNPDVLYVSAQFLPERYEGLSFKTRNGEPILALKAAGIAGVLLALTPNRPYVLRGWTESDMVFEPLPYRVGVFNAHSVEAIEGNVWIVGPESIYLFNGAFHNMLRDRQTEWQQLVKADRAIYEAGFTAHDPNDTTFYYFTHGYLTPPSWIPNPDNETIKTVAWVCDYSSTAPEVSGSFSQPAWSNDVMSREVESAGLLAIPGGRREDLYLGSCDGTSRVKDPTNADDDGDDYGKRFWLRTAHYLMGDPGGNLSEGKTLQRAWSYVESESKAWTVYIRGGDEKAYTQQLPDNTLYFWKDDVAASALTEAVGGFTITYAAKTVHVHAPTQCSGRGFTFDYTCLTPLGFRQSGIGGVYRRGPATRGVVARAGDPG